MELSREVAHVIRNQKADEHIEVIDAYLSNSRRDSKVSIVTKRICNNQLTDPLSRLLPIKRSPEKRNETIRKI